MLKYTANTGLVMIYQQTETNELYEGGNCLVEWRRERVVYVTLAISPFRVREITNLTTTPLKGIQSSARWHPLPLTNLDKLATRKKGCG